MKTQIAAIIFATCGSVVRADTSLYFTLAADENAHTWSVSASIQGSSGGLSAADFSIYGAGGVDITSSHNAMPPEFTFARTDGEAGVMVQGAQTPGTTTVGGYGIPDPVLLATGTYSGNTGWLYIAADPRDQALLMVGGGWPTFSPDQAFGGLLPIVPGDANQDGIVNFRDFVILSNHFSLSGQTWSDGDFTGDGLVNFSDFVVLSNNFGGGTTGLVGTSAPEPLSMLMLAPAIFLLKKRGA